MFQAIGCKSLLALSAAAIFIASPAMCGAAKQHPVGLANVLTSKDGSQIFGFDIDQSGDDGVLATATSVETFDQDAGTITKSIVTKNTARNSYSADGIFASDVGLITHYITPKGQIYARRAYQTLNPVTGNKMNGKWTPPLNDVDIQLVAENQASTTSVVYVIELKKQDNPDLIVSNIGANTFGKTIALDPNYFGLGNGPQLAQYTSANEAVMAESPDGGAVGGDPPINFVFDLKTGKSTQFNGYNNGPFHAGDVNGLATDPNTGVSATTTELNAQVEFYDVANQVGITAVQLPCTSDTDQTFSGSGIAIDPVNKLFLVSELSDACNDGQSAAIVVYDESGNYIEEIPGFAYTNDTVIASPPAINPSKRMGWVFGGPKGVSQLQQFYY
jgi:hypothetical protein